MQRQEEKKKCKCPNHSLTCGYEKDWCCDNCGMLKIHLEELKQKKQTK